MKVVIERDWIWFGLYSLDFNRFDVLHRGLAPIKLEFQLEKSRLGPHFILMVTCRTSIAIEMHEADHVCIESRWLSTLITCDSLLSLVLGHVALLGLHKTR